MQERDDRAHTHSGGLADGPLRHDPAVGSALLPFGDDLMQSARRVRASLEQQGHVLLVHYILPTDYPATGDAASEGFIAATGFAPILQRREAAYRLDLLRA
jgi:hypothetical protein